MRNFRFLKVIALLTMVAMMLTATVSAAVIDRAVYNVNTDTITVSGNMQGVDRTLLSENLLLNSDCSSLTNDAGDVWQIRGTTQTASIGVINGSDGNRFNPNNNLTRAEMAKIMSALLEITDNM